MSVDVAVVGAGVIGLAVARRLVLAGREVAVLESAPAVGTATSSRNSGVIHSGIYYAPQSLKARLCVRGNALLYELCERRRLAHRRCGKLVVAAEERGVGTLHEYARRAYLNGVAGVELLSSAQTAALEPQVRGAASLLVPSAGIVDVHELMSALVSDIEAGDGFIVLSSAVERIERHPHGFQLIVADGRGSRLACRQVVNSAGLQATSLAGRIEGLDARHVPTARFARGHYYALGGSPPFRRLVYPLADAHSLGVHATLDLAGRVRFGPDVQWVEEIDYEFGGDRRVAFAAAIRPYYPQIDASRLTPDYTGIRPKIYAPDEPAADFRIDGAGRHGVPGLINLFGIESPGLTSCLAIADEVAEMLGEDG